MDAVERALAEDIREGDATTDAVYEGERRVRGEIVAKDDAVVAGMAVAKEVFLQLDPEFIFEPNVSDGERASLGQSIAEFAGFASTALTGERTALNFIQRLSGVATMARRFVEAVEGTKATILDTRKTTPGLRDLEKWATRLGGATNHRFGLYDQYLIKENHIAAAGSLTRAVQRCRRHNERAARSLPIEVETKNLIEVREALLVGVDRIMFDNFDVALIAEAVLVVDGAAETEASGGVTLETVRAIAETGVEFISVGAITTSAKAFDCSAIVAPD
ncbi:MAG: carboxylating nicotinate-nucleotide diphosphorylase [Ignavibacteriales bacterium]|nr:carboxylating nicotinate-nucleotide diphosphorylase [Ignavibacteriales bacterium]